MSRRGLIALILAPTVVAALILRFVLLEHSMLTICGTAPAAAFSPYELQVLNQLSNRQQKYRTCVSAPRTQVDPTESAIVELSAPANSDRVAQLQWKNIAQPCAADLDAPERLFDVMLTMPRLFSPSGESGRCDRFGSENQVLENGDTRFFYMFVDNNNPGLEHDIR